MIVLDELTDKVYINISQGLYLVDKESACGKTYMCSMLEKYRVRGYPVCSYTYSDVGKVDINNILDIEKYKLVFIDRYDMYKDIYNSNIIKFVERGGTVIIDCKESFKIQGKCKICFVEIKEPKVIEVG